MVWLIRMLILLFLLAGSACAGTLATDDLRLTCGGWQENPALLGMWRTTDDGAARSFVLTSESVRYDSDPQTFAYAVCYSGQVDVLIVNDAEFSYFLTGDRLILDGRLYVRQ